jgi:hypothetical protein
MKWPLVLALAWWAAPARSAPRAPARVELAPLVFRVPAPTDPALDGTAPFLVADDLPARLDKAVRAHPELARAARRLVVDKGRFQLAAVVGDLVLKRYVINLGFSPDGPKLRQGDGRTPEGRYYIRDKHDSRFLRFFGLSYPAGRDAERGLAEGRIDRQTALRLHEDERRGRQPDWSTALGGAVGIHGGGGYLDEGATVVLRSWTWGCVALRDRDIRELDRFATDGTAVDIVTGPESR